MFSDISHQDKIILPELTFWACHGNLPQEKTEKQEFRLSVSMTLDTTEAAESDDLADTVDYGEIYGYIERVMLGAQHNLLESLASEIAYVILQKEQIQAVTVRLEKVAAPVAGGIRAILEIERTVADYGL
jgi:dihydroneopterin aldolase